MKNNFTLINYFETPTILQKLGLLKESDWIGNKARLKNIDAYLRTQTIVVRGKNWIDCHPDYTNKFEKLFEKELIDLHNFFLYLYKKGQLTTFTIVKLPATSTISSHKNDNLDLGCKRYVLPVLTNPDVHFQVGDERKSMCANEIWEINTSDNFRVENYSCNDCIHIIFDWKLEA